MQSIFYKGSQICTVHFVTYSDCSTCYKCSLTKQWVGAEAKPVLKLSGEAFLSAFLQIAARGVENLLQPVKRGEREGSVKRVFKSVLAE